VLTPVILATWEAKIRRITAQGQPRQIVPETPISKITRAKWTGSVAHVVEYLLCKCEALNSNPSPPKKKNFEKKKVRQRKLCVVGSHLCDILGKAKTIEEEPDQRC
jgi:hypothetical protein